MFCGHSDVVSTRGQESEWKTPPYEATVKETGGEERMYGRGTVDMKGGNEAAIQAILLAAKDVGKLKEPLYLAITYSEELGPGLERDDFQAAMEKMKAETKCAVKPEAVIVAEPTNSEILFAHKGGTGFIIDVQGNENTNAFDYASMFASKLLDEQAQLMKDQTTHDNIFDPPYAIINAGIINFDTHSNKATIEVHTRLTPKVGFDKIQEIIHQARDETSAVMASAPPHYIAREGDINLSYELNFRGIGGHSAYPEKGVSTIAAIGKVMKEIRALKE